MKNLPSNRLYPLSMILGLFFFIIACDENSESEEALPDLELTLAVSEHEIKAGDNVTYSIDGFDPEKITYAWTFDGGEPATSTELEPVITYNTPGKYGAQLTVTRTEDEKTFEASLPDTVTVTEVVAGEVVASFVSDVKSIERGGTVTYTSQSTSGASLVWTFEGGNPGTSTAEEVTVTYATAGSFDVKLVATLDEATDTKETANYVTVLPLVADFTTSNTTIEEGATVTYTSTGTTGATLAWTFQGGTPETATTSPVTITYNSSGTYDVSLKATKNGIDFEKKQTGLITVNESAVPPAPTPATFVSAKLSNDGLTISLKYDKELNDPAGDASNMVVNVDSSPATIASLTLASGDATTIIVELSSAVTAGQSISVTYAPGIKTTEDEAVNSISDVGVTNTLPTGDIIVDSGVSGNFDSDAIGWILDPIPNGSAVTDPNLTVGASIIRDATGGETGSGALKVVLNEGGVVQIDNPAGSQNRNRFFIRTENEIAFENGVQYQFSIRLKVENKAGLKSMNIRLEEANSVQPPDEQRRFIGNNLITEDWQTIENTFTLPSSSTVTDGVVELEVLGEPATSGGGVTTTLYIDSISITEAP